MKVCADIVAKRLRNTILIFFLLSVTCVANSKAQEPTSSPGKVSQPVSEETLRQVQDILFPIDEFKAGRIEFGFILRFRPTYEADSQIIIIKRPNKVEVIEFTSLDGNIENKLNEILERTGREDATEMAKMIHIRKRMVKVSPTLINTWRSSFINSIYKSLDQSSMPKPNKSGVFTAIIHGTFYNLRFEAGSEEILYSTHGSEINTPLSSGDSPIIIWMNDIRQQIKKLPSMPDNIR